MPDILPRSRRPIRPTAVPGHGPARPGGPGSRDLRQRYRAGASLISPTTAAEVNRSRILQALYDLGPLTRADLARLAGVTRATIGTIVQPMIDQRVLVEREAQPSSAAGGKPARPLWFSPSSRPIAAVHLLPGRVRAALVNVAGTVLTRTSGGFPANTKHADVVVDCIVECLRQVLPAEGVPVLGVGIAVAGMVDTDTGTILAINLAPGLAGLPIGPLVAERIGAPVHIDLHPRTQALGDRWFGQGRGVSSFASIYTGEAIGVGLVLDGRIHRGAGGAGGEIGHTIVDLDGELCRCGKRGCWETIATHRWLRAEAARLDLPSARRMTAGPLARLAAKGHQHAAELFDRYAWNLAVGIANLQQILAPDLFILHGDAPAGGEALRSRIEYHVQDNLPPRPGGHPQIAFTDLDDDATLLGAAGLVLSHSLQLVA